MNERGQPWALTGALALAALGMSSCAGEDESAGDDAGAPHGSAAGTAGSGPSGCNTDDLDYPTLAALHAQAVARTCALNEGVCHNSKEYHDLRSVTALLEAIGEPCNMAAGARDLVHDACEGPGDRLIVPSLLLDAEVMWAFLLPEGTETFDAEYAVLTMTAPIVLDAAAFASDAVVQRADGIADLGGLGVGLYSADDGYSVVLDLTLADPAVKKFLDDRKYPWTDDLIRVADVNLNGVPGSAAGMTLRLIEPGSPETSYLMKRLVDPSYGELMPRQCRTWDDRATRALGCWIQQLVVDDSGQPINAHDPIDYASCTYDIGTEGICSAQTPEPGDVSFEAVEGIFAKHCGGSSCHVNEQDEPEGKLDLSKSLAYSNLVGVPSTQSPMVRVAPGAPEESYLACKLGIGDCDRAGALMPLGSTLDECEKAALTGWIEQGAELPPDGQ